ncbi:MAG: YCF48-related protein [Planctomycetota bacterium]
MRRCQHSLFATLICVAFTPAIDANGLLTLDDALADSASLRDVEFIDPRRGWAVGDRGVVLQTTDGGEHWLRVGTPTEHALYGVSFVDERHGWAIGGAIRPYTHESRGVVLATSNGGRDWQVVSQADTPLLRSVCFFDPKNGVAAGDGTPLHPSGVFTTDDGGRHWRPLPGAAVQHWQAADFLLDRVGELAGVVAGLRGVSARAVSRELSPSIGAGDRRGGYGVALSDAATGWLVGDGGMVQVTSDGGKAWGPPPRDPSARLAEWFDWRAVAARGDRVWIAGSPGSIVLSSDDGGRTWQTARTGITTPITAITFTSETHGWAVGELGVVLTTRDGGRTWRTQRAEGHRAAAGLVVATAEQFPTELLATHAAAEGYRTVALAPLVPEASSTASTQLARLGDAAKLVGVDAVDAGWAVPLSEADANLPATDLLRRLDRLTDGQTRELLVSHLQRWLLTYRPEVVVIPASTSESVGLASLLTDATVEAVQRAKQTPPRETGLGPCQVRRVVAVRPELAAEPLAANEVRQTTGDFSSLLGATPAQWRHQARGLLTAEYTAAPPAYRWSVVAGGAAATGRPDLLAGIASPRGGEARRPAAVAPANQLDQLRRIAAKRRNMERLLDQAAGDPAWAGQVVNLTGGLDSEAGAELLSQLAEGYRQAGRLELAADTLYLLARRYPEAPLADASLLWLVRYYASAERSHANERSAGVNARSDTLSNVPSSANVISQLAAPDKSGTLSTADRLERAAALIDFLEQSRPALFAQPAVRVADAATQRARGFGSEADKIALLLSKRSIADDWRRAAQAERWLAKPEGLPPEKPIVECRYTPRRPKLDGQLDDVVWTQTTPVRLAEGRQTDATASVHVAHDEDFLFVAIEATSGETEAIDDAVARPRDADLTSRDRVRMRIDTDRDYTTAYELTIDARGWTHDALWSDSHWDPKWYVAANREGDGWRAEVAIPLAELADPKHLARAAWAVSLEQIRPGKAPAAWPTARAATGSPDVFGLMLFD